MVRERPQSARQAIREGPARDGSQGQQQSCAPTRTHNRPITSRLLDAFRDDGLEAFDGTAVTVDDEHIVGNPAPQPEIEVPR